MQNSIIRKTKCYRSAKRNVRNAKRNVYFLRGIPLLTQNEIITLFYRCYNLVLLFYN